VRGEEVVEDDMVGEVVDCADEPGEGGLEDDLEDCFGVEAGLRGLGDGGVGDFAPPQHEFACELVHGRGGVVGWGVSLPHDVEVCFVDVEAGEHGGVERHPVVVVDGDTDRQAGHLAQHGIKLGRGHRPSQSVETNEQGRGGSPRSPRGWGPARGRRRCPP
jgi:hypothetical protein